MLKNLAESNSIYTFAVLLDIHYIFSPLLRKARTAVFLCPYESKVNARFLNGSNKVFIRFSDGF